MDSRMFPALAFLAAFAVAAPALSQTKPDDRPQNLGQPDPVTLFENTDETMNAAIAEANASLPLFLTHAFSADGLGLPSAMLKVAIPAASQGGDEVIWVSGLSRIPTGFAGYLANAPVDLGDLREGDYVEFDASQISDWALRSPSGQLFGHYTTRVIADLPGNGHLWQLLEPHPIPTDWR